MIVYRHCAGWTDGRVCLHELCQWSRSRWRTRLAGYSWVTWMKRMFSSGTHNAVITAMCYLMLVLSRYGAFVLPLCQLKSHLSPSTSCSLLVVLITCGPKSFRQLLVCWSSSFFVAGLQLLLHLSNDGKNILLYILKLKIVCIIWLFRVITFMWSSKKKYYFSSVDVPDYIE